MTLIIEASSELEDFIWEPFGGLFTASIAAKNLGRKYWTYFFYGV